MDDVVTHLGEIQEEAPPVKTARDLAERLAGMARIVRGRIVAGFKSEKEKGWLHNWLAAFRKALIPTLDEAEFADMFAQTAAYGYFAAKVHVPDKSLSRASAARNLPNTEPFLRKFFAEIAGGDLPDSILLAVDDIVALLNRVDLATVLRDFGKGQDDKDPVVHFYETFLTAYDPHTRQLRGVYYTHKTVVSYMVRSVDSMLISRFARPQGLADEDVTILDPAVGTATFLYYVIQHIHRKFARRKVAWKGYVARHLLGRIFGFEILPAPYSVACLKLGMLLQETGYDVDSGPPLGFYLANALDGDVLRTGAETGVAFRSAKERGFRGAKGDNTTSIDSPVPSSEPLLGPGVAEGANAAADVQREKEILVVLGNPPYSGIPANRGEWIVQLVRDYRQVDGKPLGEKKVWLADDYVKFLRFAQWQVAQSGQGVVAMVTNHGYLDNPTFRGMRQSLLRDFDEIHVLDLHGNSKKRQRPPGGGKDENVFDIQQGVAIAVLVRYENHREPAKVFHADLWGTREEKYKQLAEHDVTTIAAKELSPSAPYYFFVPRVEKHRREYEKYWKLPDAMPVYVAGFITARDHFVVDFDRRDLLSRIGLLADPELPDTEIRSRYFSGRGSDKYPDGDTRGWKLPDARQRIREDASWQERTRSCCYRPFDNRWIYWADWMVDWPRPEVSRHMLLGGNLGLITPKRVESQAEWQHALVADEITDHVAVSLKSVDYLFPLRLDPSNGRTPVPKTEQTANFAAAFLKALADQLDLERQGPHGLPKGVTPEDIFHYAYAVLHCPTYRARYTEFVKVDFPRLPLTGSLKLFRDLAAQGAELVALHLMKSAKLDDFLTPWPVEGDNVVEKVGYAEKDGRVWINEKQYFTGVPLPVWEFHVGGYQVCRKWLKDRKGRTLTCDDTRHYRKIVVALSETMRIMEEIDAIIATHGGWPIQ